MPRFWLAPALALLSLSAPAIATPKTPEPAPVYYTPARATGLELRVEQLVPLMNREVVLYDYFSPTFLAAIPPEQFNPVRDSLIAQYGPPVKVASFVKSRANGATVKLAFSKAIVTVELDVEAADPGRVIGLAITGVELVGDSLEAIEAEFKTLPWGSGFLLAELGDDGSAREVAAYNPHVQFAIGSTFKLYILAELAAQVKAGDRKWSDVVPLTHQSFSSAATQGWPKDSPVTLHTLAGWMISVSDNGATDTLLHRLGRQAVEQRLALIGHSAPDKTLPFLSTVEAFALKSNPELRTRFLKASEAEQRDLIKSEQASLTLEKIDGSTIGGAPASIGTIEWFASPADVVTLMRHIRLQSDDRMMGIMAINNPLGPELAKKWRYVGYKGGSEPGVISMSYLLQSHSGKWYVATGSWNNELAEVDNAKFKGLMDRLVTVMAE
jgi:beta-lactamase class A